MSRSGFWLTHRWNGFNLRSLCRHTTLRQHRALRLIESSRASCGGSVRGNGDGVAWRQGTSRPVDLMWEREIKGGRWSGPWRRVTE